MLKVFSISILLLAALAATSSNNSQNGVRLTLRGVQYHDNNIIDIFDVEENNLALTCQTDLRPCCRSSGFRAGEWYYPDGTVVPVEGTGSDFYRNRGDDGTVRLNRRNNANHPTGIYHCEVPDENNITRTLHIGLLELNSGHFGDSVVDLIYGNNNFTLTCLTSGAPATSVYGECVNKDCPHSQLEITVEPVTLLYRNTLILESQANTSHFVCVTRRAEITSYATFLTKFGKDETENLSSQLVGRVGEQVTLLCLADEQIQNVSWTRGTRVTPNITFPHLHPTNAGVYMCSGATEQNGLVSHSVNLVISQCNAVVWITRSATMATIGRNYPLTCNTQLWGTGCTIDAYLIYREGQLKSTNSTFTFRPLKLSDAGYYWCTATVKGFNFTSHQSFNPANIQIPTPMVDISSSLDNPIPRDSIPTLSCIIRLDPSVDREVEVSVLWRGPVYGFGEFTKTEPVLNNTAEVPTYTSSATLNAEETFYDSGQYRCLVLVSPPSHQSYISSTSTSSQSISVLFQFPRRPSLHRSTINNIGESWIYLTWNQNSDNNISNYEVKYSYVGECNGPGVDRGVHTEMISSVNSSYNITGLGEYFNYSINLTAINGTGRSPPNIAFALTNSAAPSGAPETFTATSVLSTNVTVQWGRVSCSERNSEISHYTLRYSLVGEGIHAGEVNVIGVGDRDRMYTVIKLHPQSIYTLTIAAVNTDEQMGPVNAINITTDTPESVAFQLQLIGVLNCLQWRISDPVNKVHDISMEIANGINELCPLCELGGDDITEGEFQCFPGSPNQVTFRGKVQDRAPATAREVIEYIEQWITSSAVITIPVHHARLRINGTCVVLLASLDDPECPAYLIMQLPVVSSSTFQDTTSTTTFPSTTRTSQEPNTPKVETFSPLITTLPHLDVGAIVGGAVMIVLIITVGIITVLLPYIILKYRLTKHTSQEVPPEDGSSNKSASKTGDGQTYLELESTCVSHSNRFYVPHKEQGHVAVTPPDNCNNSTLDTQKETQEESYYELSC